MSIATIPGNLKPVLPEKAPFDALGMLSGASKVLGGLSGMPGFTGGSATSSATSQSSGSNVQSSPFIVGEGNRVDNQPSVTATGPTNTDGGQGNITPANSVGGQLVGMVIPLAIIGGAVWVASRAVR
jgi:hypothetical protein